MFPLRKRLSIAVPRRGTSGVQKLNEHYSQSFAGVKLKPLHVHTMNAHAPRRAIARSAAIQSSGVSMFRLNGASITYAATLSP